MASGFALHRLIIQTPKTLNQSFHDAGYLEAPSNTSDIDSQTEFYPPENASSSSTEPLVSHWNGARIIKRGSFTVQPDGHTYTYSYGPKGLAGLRHNYYALLCAFFASIGGLDFGYDQGVVCYYCFYLFWFRWLN
jgi:hypothetical protein